ncbi:MAG: HlyC/CorC family transporter [Lentisphaerae bacterium]|nr:HlyC/CorC family transporter [Lentisphaerota bacterium]
MSTYLLIIGLATLTVLLGFSAFFSASETVLFSLNPIQVQRIRDRDRKAGVRVATLLANPPRTLSTILIGNTLVNVAIASLGYALISQLVAPGWDEAVAIPIMTLLLLLFGEITPKRIAILWAERLAPSVSIWIERLQFLFAPIDRLLVAITRRFHKTLTPERNSLNDEELMTLVEVSAEQGAIDKDEQVMVDGILRLSELQASDVMTPRVDTLGIDLHDPPETHMQTARSAHFRQLPVYNRTLDAIEGFLDVTRYLIDPEHQLRRHVTPALFVPDNIALDDLLITFQRSHATIACVLDEYGGTAGLVTRGDILELMTGGDESGLPDDVQAIRPSGESSWIVDGKTSLEAINHELDLNLDADDANRISGWCTFHAGALLRVGETVQAQGCRVRVLRMRKRRIDQVMLDVLRSSLPADLDGTDRSYLDEDPDA